MTFLTEWRVWLLLWVLQPSGITAGGLPEPYLTLYGTVYNAQGVRQTNGVLAINLKDPAGKLVVALQSPLTNINDQYSYAIRIPCERTVVDGKPTSGRLALNSTNRLDRAEITVDGRRFLYLIPGAATIELSPGARGAYLRGDISPTGPLAQGDDDHLLDSWERRYFGDLRYGDLDDPDGDGVPNIEEQAAGTDPTDPNSALAFTHVETTAAGVTVSWSSMPGRSYRLYRSSDVLSGFTVLVDNLPATAPVNHFEDTHARALPAVFYKVEVKP